MSSLKSLVLEEEKLNFFDNLFANLKINEIEPAHVVMSPEDWVLAREIPNIFSPEKKEERFDKGCCAWLWGAFVWIDKNADEIKIYGKPHFAALEKDFPELAKNIKELQ